MPPVFTVVCVNISRIRREIHAVNWPGGHGPERLQLFVVITIEK
jgi:hypothetical protein